MSVSRRAVFLKWLRRCYMVLLVIIECLFLSFIVDMISLVNRIKEMRNDCSSASCPDTEIRYLRIEITIYSIILAFGFVKMVFSCIGVLRMNACLMAGVIMDVLLSSVLLWCLWKNIGDGLLASCFTAILLDGVVASLLLWQIKQIFTAIMTT